METWRVGRPPLLWTGTWRKADTTFLGHKLEVRFISEGVWRYSIDDEKKGTANARESAMKKAKLFTPRPDVCPSCGQKLLGSKV